MNWSSVKNLLIAILVAANLFLVYNIIRQNRTRGYIPAEEAAGAVELLAERGLLVDEDVIPLKKIKAEVYESVYSDEYYTKAAQAMSASPREMLLALPEGGFSITAQNGDLAEFDTEFGFRYTKNDKLDSKAYTDITAESFWEMSKSWQSLSGSRMKPLAKKADAFLNSRASADSELHTEIKVGYTDPQSGLAYLYAMQFIGEGEIYSHFAVCVFEGETLISAHGRWFFDDLQGDYSTEIIDQINILFSDLNELRSDMAVYSAEWDGDVSDGGFSDYERPENEMKEFSEFPGITDMNLCYITYWNADKTTLYFVPAWQIDHTDGVATVYNAINGTTYASK